ncbi:MAG TPA: GNAT family N-acetyltransferase [Candidatus Deferrimicrobiaceae bacterium]|jgi:N-acetylglutamate synthase-like GNAT family acetyltransferase|nr:GNAT family N-acetyltransferase [Candidatus Deferrimicrobiaceae bacterium]
MPLSSSPQIEIRHATAEEAASIANLLYESFVAFQSLYTEGGFIATTPSAQQVLERMRAGPVWTVLRDGQVLGTAAVVVKGKSAYIRGMAVLPSERGTGMGSALLQHVEDWAMNSGCVRLFLSTTPFLIEAIRLYERFGFRRTDEGPHDLLGTPLFTMEKTISPRN